MTQDKQPSSLFDTGTLVIIFVAIVGVVLFIFVTSLSDFTASTDDSHAEYYASVEERIRPFGRVRLPGDELAPGEIRVDEVPPAEPVATLLSGPQVFNEACIVCHGTGIGGAPTLADSAPPGAGNSSVRRRAGGIGNTGIGGNARCSASRPGAAWR